MGADRADAPPRGDGRTSSPSSTTSTPTAREVSFQALRSIPRLEAALKETLRLHPPLIILLRVVQEEIELAGHTDPGRHDGRPRRRGSRTGSPRTSPSPTSFDPGRYLDPRQEDLQNRWTWIPFGAGKHRCVGNAFAMMQLKAIFSVILRDYEFEMAQPSEAYRDDTSKMVIQLAAALPGALPAAGAMKVVADLGLCQGHQMCQGEAPDVFGFDEDADKVVAARRAPRRLPAAAGRRRPSSTAQPWRCRRSRRTTR